MEGLPGPAALRADDAEAPLAGDAPDRDERRAVVDRAVVHARVELGRGSELIEP
ncbi:MAG: hypothetical protein M3377_07845 [Actinomycetota bacterium]|nr:hypothetical protein [Actinomycetota bacterium]